ncbi:hypothetical protein GCM10023196_069220 [Actinoallomurus vinaceus]|uniref:Uncharacterized protein n=1 Tax=Actinoallomurus vinaceus TaxID=1080074 RepID=A0ABP8UL50_9ACTN
MIPAATMPPIEPEMGNEMTIPDELDLSAGQYIKGIKLNEKIFIAQTNFNQLKVITRNPTMLQEGARRPDYDDDLASEAEIHNLIQRALVGAKKNNVPKYRDYIERVVSGGVGVLPPMHLWSEQELKLVELGSTVYVLVPNDDHLLAIDGETQLTAHWTLSGSASPELKDLHRKYPLGVMIHHNVPIEEARQYFHDLNVLAVRPNTSLSLSMDTRDPVMQVVGGLEAKVQFLRGRIDRQSRQLPKRSTKVVTLQSLRQMVVNIARGISGIQYGTKPAPVDDIDLDDLKDVAVSWVNAYVNIFANEIVDRERYLAGAGSVLAAVGAMGQVLLQTEPSQRPVVEEKLLDMLREVDWSKGDQWVGIAGNRTPTGHFSVKGTKEVAYAVFNALTDRDNSSYVRVRQGGGSSRRSNHSISPHDSSEDLFGDLGID